MASPSRPVSAALALTLLTYEGTLPADLVRTLVNLSLQQKYSLPCVDALLDRRELTIEDLDRIAAYVSTEPYTPAALAGKLLARLPVRAGDDATKHLQRLARGRGDTATRVFHLLSNPLVRDDVLDILEESTDPAILASYAHHTPRGIAARRGALDRLAGVLGPNLTRLNEETARQAASALAKLLAADLAVGRAQLLATTNRPVLLALGAEETPWAREQTLAMLDEATRAHLIAQAVLPVYTDKKPTKKDRDRAWTLLTRLKDHLDVDILRQLVPFLPREQARTISAEIIAKGGAEFEPARWTLLTLAYNAGTAGTARPAAARWLLEALENSAQTLGWEALLVLADEACQEATSPADLRTILDAIATEPTRQTA